MAPHSEPGNDPGVQADRVRVVVRRGLFERLLRDAVPGLEVEDLHYGPGFYGSASTLAAVILAAIAVLGPADAEMLARSVKSHATATPGLYGYWFPGLELF
jgi:hypothetical protein